MVSRLAKEELALERKVLVEEEREACKREHDEVRAAWDALAAREVGMGIEM